MIQPELIRKGRLYLPEEILPRVVFGKNKKKRKELDGDMINFGSLRLQTFASKGIACVSCDLVGSFFIKEKHREQDKIWHLNLYAVSESAKEVLMTRDHKIPLSRGGKDCLSNLQPMCFPCNQEKGDREEKFKCLNGSCS